MPFVPVQKAPRQQIVDDIAATLTDGWMHLGRGSLTSVEIAKKWLEIRTAVDAVYPSV